MAAQRTASRQVASSISAGTGLAITVAALVVMVIDHATGDSVATRVHEIYAPHGTIPDPIVPWIVLYGVFGAGTVAWAIALRGTLRGARWSRWWSTACFIVGSAALLFVFMVSEHGEAILPLSWRIWCATLAGFGVVAIAIAWLPTTERITE